MPVHTCVCASISNWTVWRIFIKLSTGVSLQKKNRRSENHSLSGVVWEVLLAFSTFLSDWIEVGTGNVRKNLLNVESFVKIGPVKALRYLGWGGVNTFLSVRSTTYFRFWWNSAHDIWTKCSSAFVKYTKIIQEKFVHFSYRRTRNYVYVCIVNKRNILKVNRLSLCTASNGAHSLLSCFNLQAPCVLYIGQAFHYSPENAFYIFNQQIYFIIWYLLARASLI